MYFSIPSMDALRKYKHIPLKNNPAIQASAYSFYVTLMNCRAEAIGITPDVLEQFVFGEDLRRNRGESNPRKELLGIIEEAVTCE